MSGPAPAGVAAGLAGGVMSYRPTGADTAAAGVRERGVRVTIHKASAVDEAKAVIGEVDVVWAWKFPPILYEKAARLAWLETMGAGVDWALAPELPSSVTVTRAAGVFGPWMAEYTLGWCLHVTQRMGAYGA